MRKKRLVRVGLLIALALVLIGVGVYVWSFRSYKPNVTLTISTAQREFKQGEPIPVTCTVTNTGESAFPNYYQNRWYERYPRINRILVRIPFMRRRLSRSYPEPKYKLAVREQNGTLLPVPEDFSMIVDASMKSNNLWLFEFGESKSRTMELNRWALISEPGLYTIQGIYTNENNMNRKDEVLVHAQSKPVEIVIRRRPYDEMGRYIDELVTQLEPRRKRDQGTSLAIERLSYTRDNRIVRPLLEFLYKEEYSRLLEKTFLYYLPLEPETKEMVVETAAEQGLAGDTLRGVLKRFGCSEEEFRVLIATSLSSPEPRCVKAGAQAAGSYPDDSHMGRLIELATAADSPARIAAMRAIARNRTDEGVETLRILLEDPNEKCRNAASEAVKDAYRVFRHYQQPVKRKLQMSDLVARAGDVESRWRWRAFWPLVSYLERGQGVRPSELLEDPETEIPSGEAYKGLKLIKALLNDSNKDVRDFISYVIRTMRVGYAGRPLKEEDFPRLYEKSKRGYEYAWYDW